MTPHADFASTWLALDIGTGAVKAALLRGGQVLRTATHSYPTYSAGAGQQEQHAVDWWTASVQAIRALELTTTPPDAIALTGQMQDVILLDAAGAAVRPVILYSDTRASAEMDEIRSALGDERLQRSTGNVQDAGSLLGKLLWLKRHEPATLERSHHLLLSAADVVAQRLTGTYATDTTTASATGLADIHTGGQIPAAWLESFGLSATLSLLPPFVAGGTLVGHSTAPAATQCGLPVGLPVHLGPGDAGAATLGVGAGGQSSPYAYIGTSGWVGLTRSSLADPTTGVYNLAHPQAGRVFCLAPLLTAGGNLDWWSGILGADHAALVDAACQLAPEKLLYLPYLNGERAPFHDPLARGAFIGLSAHHTRAHLSRAVLEGVVYAYRQTLTALDANARSLIVTGGGAQSLAWCQLFADLLGLPVTIAGAGEFVGLRGAVLAAQVQNGRFSSYQPAGFFPPPTHMLQPKTAHRAHYDAQYARFCAAYPALQGLFHS